MKTKQSFFQQYYRAESDEPQHPPCQETGCDQAGPYKAPKDRYGNYYQFCLQHVQAYNARWNYYGSMNETHIEAELKADTGWRRPTWPLGGNRFPGNSFTLHDPLDFTVPRAKEKKSEPALASDVQQALDTLHLTWPFDLKQLKSHYKKLVKEYHPDTNQHNPAAEDTLKNINVAYHVLKKFIQ